MSKNSDGVFGKLTGKPVIVRSTVAGVHCGILETADAAQACRRIREAVRALRAVAVGKAGGTDGR